jgi:ABC-type branched-subunit amino acid transport system permease subunit
MYFPALIVFIHAVIQGFVTGIWTLRLKGIYGLICIYAIGKQNVWDDY